MAMGLKPRQEVRQKRWQQGCQKKKNNPQKCRQEGKREQLGDANGNRQEGRSAFEACTIMKRHGQKRTGRKARESNEGVPKNASTNTGFSLDSFKTRFRLDEGTKAKAQSVGFVDWQGSMLRLVSGTDAFLLLRPVKTGRRSADALTVDLVGWQGMCFVQFRAQFLAFCIRQPQQANCLSACLLVHKLVVSKFAFFDLGLPMCFQQLTLEQASSQKPNQVSDDFCHCYQQVTTGIGL